MKSAGDLAKEPFTASTEHVRLAKTLRQTAGRVSSVAGSDVFSDKQRRVLEDAIRILEDGAKVRRQAAFLKAKIEDAEEARRREIAGHVSSTFGGLQTVEEKVALLASVDRHRVRSVQIESNDDLDFYLKGSMDDLVWTLARQDGEPQEVVAAAWEKFCKARPRLEEAHALLVLRVRRATAARGTADGK